MTYNRTRMKYLVLLLALLCLCCHNEAITKEYYMDSDSTCGQTYTIYDSTVVVGARASISSANPKPTCTFTLLSGYTDSYYYIKIERTSIIQDCAFNLNIYQGTSAAGLPLKSFSCGVSPTGITIVKSSSVTIFLSQPRELYQPQNTFSLRITTYRDPNAPDATERVSSLPTGAIIGIVVGIFIFIAFGVLMCWCYRQGKLQFLQGEREKAYTYRSSVDMNGYSEKAESTGYPDSMPASEFSRTSPNSVKRNFNLEDPNVWSTLTNTPSMGRKTKPVPVEIPKPPPLPMPGARTVNNNTERQPMISKEDNVALMSSITNRRPTDQSNGENVENASIGRVRGRRYARNSASADGKDANDIKKRNSFENKGFDDYEKEPSAVHVRNRRAASLSANPETNDASEKSKDEETTDKESKEKSKEGGPMNMLSELKRELSRRQSMKEDKGKNESESKDKGEGGNEKETSDKKESKDKSSPKRSRKKKKKSSNLPEELGDFDPKGYKGLDQQSEIGDTDKITNPMMRTNAAIRASVSSLRSRADESPGTKKKKRKKRYVGVHKDRTKSTPNEEDLEDNELDTTPVRDTDPLPARQGYNNYGNDNAPLPPEALAPVFATDSSTMQHFYPQDQYNYQSQQQPVPVLVGYDSYGNPLYNYVDQATGVAGNVPYAQAGQAAWYVQNMPSKDGPVTKTAFIMTHTASTPEQSLHGGQPGAYDPNQVPGYYIDQSGNYVPIQDMSHPGLPGYSSTPGQDPYNRQPYGKKSRSKSTSKYPGTVAVPGANHNDSIVPAGTILDDPQVPPPGGALIRSTVDPTDGTQTNQMIWTDGNRDTTDPPIGMDNPQITRKTIVRVTTRSNEEGALPAAPNPALQEMSFNAAHQLRAQGGEPAFLSPSKRGGQAYAPQPVFASETPERDNAAFYSKMAPIGTQAPPVGMSLVHDNPVKSYGIRNTVKLSPEEYSEI